MSRCFPFPPPGYEAKPRPDDVNLIKKEKKQKKHKDKKDKDQKERSERKEKERTEDKHQKDKKRKRNKHKDKKDKKKDKKSHSEEKKIVVSLVNQNGGKLVPDSKPTDSIQDQQAFPELGKRVANDCGAMGNQMVQKITLIGKTNANLLGKVQQNSNGMLAVVCNDIEGKRDYRRMAKGQSLGVDARILGNGSVGNRYGENRTKVEGGSCHLDMIEKRNDRKESNGYEHIFGEGTGRKNENQNKNTRAECEKRKEKKEEKINGGGNKKTEQGATDDIFLDFCAHNSSDLVKKSRDCQGKLLKHNELNGHLHENGIRPINMSRSALSSHQASQNGNGFHPSQNITLLAVEKQAVITNHKVIGKLSSPQPMIKDARIMKPCQNTNNASVEIPILSNGHISSNRVHIKRKMEPCRATNAVAMVKQIFTDDKSSSPHPLLENGQKMAMQGQDAVHRTDNAELKTNGALEGGKHNTSRHSSPSVKSKNKSETSMKLNPHPDLKYLSRILTVPEVEWPQCDDQEWLFGCKPSQTKRPKLASSQTHSTSQVWAEALQLEPVDVTALPYVVPY